MRLKEIKLINFRSYKDFSYKLDKTPLFIVGPNASGKTNLLESVRVLSLSKSFRTKSDKELIKFNEEFTRIEGVGSNEDKEDEFAVIVNKVGTTLTKSIKINGKAKRGIDLVGKLTTVLFTPEDLNLAYLSPGIRRRYLDISICQVDPSFCRVLNEHKNVLYNRNKILFNIREGRANSNELYFWNEKLVDLGDKIIRARLDIIKYYNQRLPKIYSDINNNEQTFEILYNTNTQDSVNKGSVRETLRAEIDMNREKEIKMARTVVGPHRDDFTLSLSKRNLSTFGSRGEVRSAIIALKLAELDFFEDRLGSRPILLLDDIFSELDHTKRNRLTSIIDKQQTIITTTDISFINENAIKRGELLELNSNKKTKI